MRNEFLGAVIILHCAYCSLFPAFLLITLLGALLCIAQSNTIPVSSGLFISRHLACMHNTKAVQLIPLANTGYHPGNIIQAIFEREHALFLDYSDSGPP